MVYNAPGHPCDLSEEGLSSYDHANMVIPVLSTKVILNDGGKHQI
jgi:hypothetical protein